MYLKPILRWKLQGDTLALQLFTPLRESFPQNLKHFRFMLSYNNGNQRGFRNDQSDISIVDIDSE